MAENTINVKVKQRTDTESNWASKNPVLLDGEHGYVKGSGKYKIGDGTKKWSELPYYESLNTTDKTKLDGIAAGANKYTHPSYTAKTSGLYKVTVDSTGHVSATTAVTKTDITALGIPSTNTTYSTGTSSTSGLTKLYTGTGTAIDGTMTQAAIKSALDGKAPSNHNHDSTYLKLAGGTVTGTTTFSNTTASVSKSTGAVKVSGGLGVAGRMSSNEVMIGDGCTLTYDVDNKCVNFVFS